MEPKSPARPPARQRDLQRTGTRIAVGVGVVFVGVLAWYAMHAGKAAAPTFVKPQGPKARPDSMVGKGNPDELLISDVENPEIPVMDKKDPHRQIGLIKCESFEPLEARHYEAAKPDAWLYLNDGRTLHIVAATGKLYMPDRDKEPESGTLSGGVVADVFEAREDGARIQAGVDAPFLTFKTQTLAFDSTLGKVSTPDRVTIVSQIADFTGTGMEILFNQVGQRLELCKIGPGDNSAVFHTGAKRGLKPKKPPGQSQNASKSPGAPPASQPITAAAPTKAPLETLYGLEFDQGVSLTQGTRNLIADKLNIWARTVDGSLPEGAIAEVRGQGQAGTAASPTSTTPAVPTTGIAAAPATTPPVASWPPVGDITLRWTGPCVIAPLPQTPPELKTEHLAARFTAEQSGAVRLDDAERGATGKAGSIEYGATSGKLLLAGHDAGRPRLEWPNAGTIETDRIEGDLTHGLIHIPARGIMRQTKRDAEVRWGEQADFSLVVRDGVVVGQLKQATFAGGFTISDKYATITGGFARADFTSTAELPNNLTRLIVSDKASAISDKSGLIAANTLDVEFVLPAPGQKAGDPVPRIVTATDHVVVERNDSRLTTDWLEAHMGRTPAGAIDVSSATARGSVKITRESDQIVGLADEMHADLGWVKKTGDESVRRQIVDLIGPETSIKRGDQSALNASQVRLDGVEHRVEVFGAGTFDHNDPQKKAVVAARWKTGMTFDDDDGRMECSGDARVVSTPDALTRDEIEADRLKLALTPMAPGESGQAPAKRELLRAEAIGSVLEREGGVNATITSERFAADPTVPEGRRREQLHYLEGPRIVADNLAGTLDVPGGGRLVFVERGASDKPAPQTPGPSGFSLAGSQGDSLFTWATSLHMDRATGQADLHGAVRLTHRSLRDRQITNMDCEHLTVVAKNKGSSLSAQGTGLTSATATGAVYATVGPEAAPGRPRPVRKELVADRVEYDAVKGTLDAAAAPHGLVSIFDPGRGSPVSASRLFWDLANDRIEVKDLEPIVGPK